MVQSMTGFGSATVIFNNRKLNIEVKSLNSKNCDLNIKLPPKYKCKELEVNNLLKTQILRGKIDFYLGIDDSAGNADFSINSKVVQNYMEDLKTLVPSADEVSLLQMATQMPGVLATSEPELSEEEWTTIATTIQKAIDALREFRNVEGTALQSKLELYVHNIQSSLKAVAPYEESRMENVKARLDANLKDFKDIDENRLYQELAYYGEKLDISEEKVRLTQHCNYFLEVLHNEQNNGKKLGFIAQEMGREINTLGSKANHPEIQKLVVQMKDDLEKIKEQTLNVL